MRLLASGAALLSCLAVYAQISPQEYQRTLQAIAPRELGPTTMGGRIHQLAVFEKDARIFYVGSASGGVWRTENGGITFNPVMQFESAVTTGGIAVDPDNSDIVWVGTGEENSRNSTTWGQGVYRTTDGGKSWNYMGLKETRHIGKIVLHPRDKNIVYVAALGNLWGPNKERGVYKTTDGGKSWSQVLYIDDLTGAIDLVIDPKNPDRLVVGMWQRLRKPWQWASGGPKSGMFRTTDGGKTWSKVTRGLPEGDTGRIGLARWRKDPNVLIATVENRQGGVYRSNDFGASWTKLNSLNPRPFYFSSPAIDPQDDKVIYIPGVNWHVSRDGGQTFRVININIHVDHHDMWINPNDSNHMLLANDGGLGQSRDGGKTWEHLNHLRLAQFYGVSFDMRKPYWVYGGLQDNGTWGGPTQTRTRGVAFYNWRFINGGDGFEAQADPVDWFIVYAQSQGGALARHNLQTGESRFIRPRPPQGETYRFNWSSPILISPHNHRTIWFGGNRLFKSVDRGDNWTVVSPDLTTNDPSKLNPRAGVTPEDTGAERHCTIVTISESPMKADTVWVGTDDGQVQLTQDGGKTWTNVTANIPDLPANTWVSRIEASRFAQGRAYATFDGHRSNDFNPYVYVTEDFGKSWSKITNGLNVEDAMYAFAEGLQNPDLLFAGSERGLYVSLDRGTSWFRIHRDLGFPTVRVDDLTIHPRELDLIVATHGRGLWILPISALEQLNAANRAKDVHLCRPTTAYFFGKTYGGWFDGDRDWVSENTPGTTIFYWLKSDATDQVEIRVIDAAGREVVRVNGGQKAGLNAVRWRPGRLPVGDYTVELKMGEITQRTSVRYEDLSEIDPRQNGLGL